jgi:hypothetical protein
VKKLPSLAARVVFELVFAAVTLYTARPAFASLHLPLQDLPQHMAAISVLKRYAFDPGLRQYFELTLSRTQYLSVYVLGVLLSVPLGVEYATRILVAITVIALPYAMRFVLRRTGGDERFAALVWPFAWNPQMLLGFLNYLIGIPFALVAIGLFADRAKRTQRRRQIALALLALAAFYSHLMPFGILGLGVLLQLETAGLADPLGALVREGQFIRENVFPALKSFGLGLFTRLKEWTYELLFLVPSLIAAILWIARSPARDASVRAGGVGRAPEPIWPNIATLPGQFRETILSLQGEADERAMIVWGLALLAALALSRAFKPDDPRVVRDARIRVAWLPLACAVLYVKTPESYGWIWPIHTRFALAAVLLLPLAFGRTKHTIAAWVVMLAVARATIPLVNELSDNFKRWDQVELGDLDEALRHAQPGRRLIALVPANRSSYVEGNVPLLHAAAYYQVRGGDVSTFSFADFPQSPFRYRENGPRPARLRPRWEWQTSLAEADPNFDYYDYVLTRVGANDEAAAHPDRYNRIYSGEQWTLYERRR